MSGHMQAGAKPPLRAWAAHALRRLHLLCCPPACHVCGRLQPPFAPWAEGYPYLCAPCVARLPWHPNPDQLASAPEASALLDAVHAGFSYEAPVDRWARTLKYYRQDGTARVLGALLALAVPPRETLVELDLLAPVPLHPSRVRGRGFNQSLLLAHHWLRCMAPHRPPHGSLSGGQPGSTESGTDGGWAALAGASGSMTPGILPPTVVLEPELLCRPRATHSQARLDGPARLNNVRGAFALGRPLRSAHADSQPLAGLRILLVDDVMSTGATLGACAAVLKEAGAQRVEALVLARP